MKTKKNLIVIALFLLVAFLSWYSYTHQGFVYFLFDQDINATVTYIQSFGSLAAIILVAIVIIEVVAAPIPPLLLYVAGGIIFGGFYGGALILIGNTIGAMLAFYIARTIGKNYLQKKTKNAKNKRFEKLTHKYGAFAIFFLRINPLTSSDLVSYLAGLSGMKATPFLISTVLGLIPLIFIQSYLGSEIISQNPLLLYLFVAISAIYALIIIYLAIRLARK